MFSRLDNRFIIKGVVRFKGPVAVATGEPNDYTDAPVMRTPRGQGEMPFIPGSSFRGALRASVERILAGLRKNVCLLGATPGKEECSRRNVDTEGKSEAEILADVESNLCPSCRLFGSTHLASKLKVADLGLAEGEDPPVVLRHRVGIDRDTETAREGAKFDGEAVVGGRFKMALMLENADDEDWGMLGLGLMELKDGFFWLGGDQSVGMGRCILEEFEIYYFGHNGYGLRDYLLSDAAGMEKYRKMAGEAAWAFIRGHVNWYLHFQEGEDAQSTGEPM